MIPSSRIKYIEYKGDGLAGDARIGRVTFSKSGKSLFYQGKSFATLKGSGYKANYYDTATGEKYWISGPRSDGGDTLYPGIVEIDDDVREEYWRDIRKSPGLAHESSFKSPGKYTQRGRGTSQ